MIEEYNLNSNYSGQHSMICILITIKYILKKQMFFLNFSYQIKILA